MAATVQNDRASVRGGRSWALCAAVVLAVAGAISVVHGVTALADDEYFGKPLLTDHVTFWGIVLCAWGIAELLAAYAVLRERPGGIMLGTLLAGLEMAIWFCLIFASPAAALIGVTLNGFVVLSLGMLSSLDFPADG